jgi:hypothetical protein
MLKKIPKSDQSIRPFKAYKEWTFYSGSNDVPLMQAENTIIYNQSNDIELPNGVTYNKHSLYGQLNSFFYKNVDSALFGVGVKSKQNSSTTGERKFDGKAKVFSIPQSIVGEEIKHGSVILTDSILNLQFLDNGSGSLMSGSTIVGDIFYQHGVICYTHTASMASTFTGDWNVYFKSTQTIIEYEYILPIDPGEFNTSTNPTAIVTVGSKTASITEVKPDNQKNTIVRNVVTDRGSEYIRKRTVLNNGQVVDYRIGSKVSPGVSGGFEHYTQSGSVDTTGSFLRPFITTIGLYDDSMNLLAVGKLPQPIKSEPDIPITFILRFDS